MKEFFQALGEFFGWKKQADDPEVIRLKTIRQIDDQIDGELKKMQQILSERSENADTKIANELLLALCSDTLSQLQYKRKTLTR